MLPTTHVCLYIQDLLFILMMKIAEILLFVEINLNCSTKILRHDDGSMLVKWVETSFEGTSRE
jgi:hypothetical protein